MQQFMHEFPDVEKGGLREQCRNTAQEYEESMLVWKEMKDTGELFTSDAHSEEEDELTGENLLRTLNKMSAATSPAAAPKAVSSYIDWPILCLYPVPNLPAGSPPPRQSWELLLRKVTVTSNRKNVYFSSVSREANSKKYEATHETNRNKSLTA
jgi:hypothetical protein